VNRDNMELMEIYAFHTLAMSKMENGKLFKVLILMNFQNKNYNYLKKNCRKKG
jgi:hypothetical protein